MRPANLTQHRGTRHRRRTCYGRTYGLTDHEIRHELRRLAHRGWQLWELRKVFDCHPCDEQERAA